MRTGPTKKGTRETIAMLQRHSRKAKKSLWKTLAKGVAKTSRLRVYVNIFELNKIAKKNPGKTIAVPGKVLATGEVEGKLVIACLDCSQAARKKIEAAKGKV
ncbi:MAG: uL15 family ribosomal protein, partial [archaeon]|nr:uL15 family ribosomal protein [archaeon]